MHTERAEDASDVIAHCGRAQSQLGSDFHRRPTLRKQPQDLALSCREMNGLVAQPDALGTTLPDEERPEHDPIASIRRAAAATTR